MQNHRVYPTFNLIFSLIFIFSLVGVPPVQAGTSLNHQQGQARSDTNAAPTPPPPPGARLGYNSTTGRLNFVGGDAAAPLASAGDLSAMGMRSAADGVLAQYAPQFGVANPAKDLRLARSSQDENGRVLRYQQQYQGVPIMGGELIVNSDTQGQVLSLNGEVSPDLALNTTTPAVSASQALQKALAGANSWYGLDAAQVIASQPALWIYDPRILQDDNQEPARLVWRIELSSNQAARPVNELVLVDVASGEIALHFSQVENFAAPQDDPPGDTPTPEALLTETPTATQAPAVEPTQEPSQTPTDVPPLPPAETPTDIPTLSPTGTALPQPTQTPGNDLQAQSGATWYVATTGSDDNDCATTTKPCATINGALAKASNGDVVDIAIGIYTGNGSQVVYITKDVDLSGGWNTDFTSQDGFSTIDGQGQRKVIEIGDGNGNPHAATTLTRLTITHAAEVGILSNAYSSLTIKDSAIRDMPFATGIKVGLAPKLAIINTTITKTSCGLDIYLPQNAVLQNATITQNGGRTDCGGILADQGHLLIRNSIIANNFDPGPKPKDCTSSVLRIVSGGFNLITNLEGCTFTPIPGDIIGKDPRLGGFLMPGYYPLRPASPAIDGGNPAAPGSGGNACDAEDFFGTPRPIDGDQNGSATCDIGAYESAPLTPPAPHFIDISGIPGLSAPVNTIYPTFSVLVRDQYGAPLPGAQVTFTAPDSGATGQFAGSAGDQVTTTTDNSGIASAPAFTANEFTGTFMVEASVAGVATPVVFQMENYISTIKEIAIAGASPQYLGRTIPATLQAIVRDNYHNPMPGVPVTFTAPTSAPSLTFNDNSDNSIAHAVTDANGLATVPVSPTAINGSYTVTATIDGYSLSVNIPMINSTYYLSPDGSDSIGAKKNDCLSSDSPCRTTNNVVWTLPNIAILIAEGTYNGWELYTGGANTKVSGGWDANYTTQESWTVIDREGTWWDVISNTAPHTEISRIRAINGNKGINNSGTLILDDVITSDNQYGISNSGTLTMNGVTVYHNQFGGFSNSGTAIVINSTFSENQNTSGSTIFNTGNLVLKNVTVTNNDGYGVQSSSASATTYIYNSIFSANKTNCYIYHGTIQSAGYNLFDKSSACQVNSDGVYSPNKTDLTGVDPKLDPLVYQTYMYYPLHPDSPAIDAVKDPDAYCPPTDQPGGPRPQGAGCDIGAYEYLAPAPPYVIYRQSALKQVMNTGNIAWEPFKVQVFDRYGTPAPGVAITFSAPASGPSAVYAATRSYSASAVSDSTGMVSSPFFTANWEAGDFTITANASQVLAPAVFQVTINNSGVYLDPPNGSDSNNCHSPTSPCKTPSGALNQVANLETLFITSGSYELTGTVTSVAKQFYLNGGWDSSFTVQNGRTKLYGVEDTTYHFNIASGEYIMTNRIDITGGGVWNYGTLVFRNGAIYHNPKGIKNQGSLTLINSTITDNLCDPDMSYCWDNMTSGIYNNGGSVMLINSTISENFMFNMITDDSAPLRVGGIYNQGGTVTLKNSIVARNRANKGFDLYGDFISQGNNTIGIINNGRITSAQGDRIGTPNHPADALLAEPTDNGGDTPTLALLPGSPAIDAADISSCPDTDQRGVPRPDGAGCDIGAYEGTAAGPNPGLTQLVFDGQGDTVYPGILLCESPQLSCTNGTDADADSVYQTAIDLNNFYWQHYRRNGLDGAGMPVVSTVHSKGTINSMWNWWQAVFANGYAKADDIVAHELTHGVVETEANLFYYYQSGAIDESLADLWGEYFDQTNGKGNDADKVKWLIGEDAPAGAIRSMKSPPAYQDPDSMKSSLYYLGSSDNGGVHTNSGVNNKAAYLMVEGGSFNGKVISPLGWDKTSAIYYYALEHLLTSGSDYADLYSDLDQACRVLAGIPGKGMTLDDCQQVRNAADAVQMNRSPNSTYNIDTDNTCPKGMIKNSPLLFSDNFENGVASWNLGSIIGNLHWGLATGYATSGRFALYGADYDPGRNSADQVSDSFAAMKNDFIDPVGTRTYLYFRHVYAFEVSSGHNYDGGVLEYSIDSGDTWKDAGSLFDAGKNYPGSIFRFPTGSNPLQGRNAFVGDSHGYVSSRYDLSSLAGNSIRFRWRLGTNYTGANLGWAVDDVELYTCVGSPAVPLLNSPVDRTLIAGHRPKLDWTDTANADHYQLQLAADADFTNIILNRPDEPISEFPLTSDLPDNATYYWRVSAVNHNGVGSGWSNVFSFRTPMLPPGLSAPVDKSTLLTPRPQFNWGKIDPATSYTLQISTAVSFSSNLVNASLTSLTYSPTTDLQLNRTLYWRVRANGYNPSDWSMPFAFTIPSNPGIPLLTAPADKSLVDSYSPLLDWTDVIPPAGLSYDYYLLQIATDVNFSYRLQNMRVDGLANSQKILDDPLQPNQTYYWRVAAGKDAGQSSAWSSTRSFRTPMLPPILVGPADGSTALTTRPGFIWETIRTATSYTIQIATIPTFSSTRVKANVYSASYTSTLDLPRDQPLYWRVRANGINPSGWSDTFSFIGGNPPGIPSLLAPADNEVVSPNLLNLDWSDAIGADHYQVQVVIDDLHVRNPVEVDYTSPSGAPSSLGPLAPLLGNETFLWRVRAYNAAGQVSQWSHVLRFHTRLPTPVLVNPGNEATISLPITLKWNGLSDESGITGYIVQVSTSKSFSSKVINRTTWDDRYTVSSGLTKGMVYYWRVQARGAYPSDWSEVRSFTVQ